MQCDDEYAGGEVEGGADERKQRVHGDARHVAVLRQVCRQDLLNREEPEQVDQHEVRLFADRQEHREEACTRKAIYHC